jgi:hypothetical protein
MGYKVGLTEEARDDLGAAVRFIAVEGENPGAALRLGHELIDAALSLAIAGYGDLRCAPVCRLTPAARPDGSVLRVSGSSRWCGP